MTQEYSDIITERAEEYAKKEGIPPKFAGKIAEFAIREIEPRERYISLLSHELNDCFPVAVIHGYNSNERRANRGDEIRRKIWGKLYSPDYVYKLER